MSEIIFTDESRAHFTSLQNILSYIGLSAFDRSVYWAIRECCGEKRNCTKSYTKLAEMAGMSEKSLRRSIESLSNENNILKKPLIQVVNRLTDCGDKDTNEIICCDLWYDNAIYFKKGGPVTQTGGVRSHRPEVRSHRPINKTYNKTYINKTTTTTPTPSVVVVVSENEKLAAKHVKDHAEKRIAEWGAEWNLSLDFLEKLMFFYGIAFVQDQYEYIIRKQSKYWKNRNMTYCKEAKIDNPEIYLSLACDKNYAKSLNIKEKKKVI